MDSLVNYDSDDDIGDFNNSEKGNSHSQQNKNEDVNYDNVGMEESSEESNNNVSDSGGGGGQSTSNTSKHERNNSPVHFRDHLRMDKAKSDGGGKNYRNFDFGQNTNSNKQHNSEQKQESNKSNSYSEKRDYDNSGGKSKHYEPKRRNSSDMDMDDEEGEDCESSSTVQKHWQQSSSAHQSHYNKSAGGSKSRSESSGEKESDLTATSTYKNSFDSNRVDHDARDDDKRRDERRRYGEQDSGRRDKERRDADSDFRRRDKESEREKRKGDYERERDRDRSRRDDREKRRSPPDSRRDHSRRRSHSPDSSSSSSRRDRERDRSPGNSKYYKRSSPDRSWKARKLEKKTAVLNKLGIELKPSPVQQITPQQLLGEQLKTQIQEVEAKTGIVLPTYYNPGVMNPMKYAQQIQKRKLLWGNKTSETKQAEVQGPAAVKQWQAATFKGDNDGKMTEKFKRLMGIKGDGSSAPATSTAAAATAAASLSSAARPVETKEIIEKQEEMFSNMEAQYQVARMATHTHRGIGLGFGTFQVPPR